MPRLVVLDGHTLSPGDNPWTELERLGYEVYGVLDDCPVGYSTYFLKKQLRA